jgi:hypothetical protein
VNPIEHAVARPFPEVLIDRRMRRKVFWQLSPLATRAIYIADRVEHLARVCLALAPTGAGQRDHRLDNSPLFVAHITRVTTTPRLVFLALFVAPHGSPAFPESAAIDRITGDSYDSRTFETGSARGDTQSGMLNAVDRVACMGCEPLQTDDPLNQGPVVRVSLVKRVGAEIVGRNLDPAALLHEAENVPFVR